MSNSIVKCFAYRYQHQLCFSLRWPKEIMGFDFYRNSLSLVSSNYQPLFSLSTDLFYSHSFSEFSCILMMWTQIKQKLPNPKLPKNPNVFQGSFLTFSNSGK